MSHNYERVSDMSQASKAFEMVFKAAKVLGLVAVVFGAAMTVRDRLGAVPVLQSQMEKVQEDIGDEKDKMSFVVGVLEGMSGRHYSPKRTR